MLRDISSEDTTKLNIDDPTFDIIISNEVFEYIKEVKKAFVEIHRVLKSRGKLISSIPFTDNNYYTFKKAEINNDEIVYMNKPVYFVAEK